MAVSGIRRGSGSFVVALALSSAVIEAQRAAPPPAPENGAEWLARCRAIARPAEESDAMRARPACLAWVEGLIDINEIYRGLGALDRSSEGFCTPARATVEDAGRAIVRYLEAHAESHRFSARIVAYMALRDAFPCARP